MTFDIHLSLQKVKTVLQRNNNVDGLLEILSLHLPAYEINSELRLAAYIAQCAYESCDFTIVNENLNYSAENLLRTFPKYFRNIDDAKAFAHQPQKIANRVYSGRMGNGGEESGDGYKYRGRGILQLTGYDNYYAFAMYTNMSIDNVIEHCSSLEGAVESACWFWKTNNLNIHADKKDMVKITKLINGGTNGLSERIEKYGKILLLLNNRF